MHIQAKLMAEKNKTRARESDLLADQMGGEKERFGDGIQAQICQQRDAHCHQDHHAQDEGETETAAEEARGDPTSSARSPEASVSSLFLLGVAGLNHEFGDLIRFLYFKE